MLCKGGCLRECPRWKHGSVHGDLPWPLYWEQYHWHQSTVKYFRSKFASKNVSTHKLSTLRCTVTCCKHVSTRSHWKLHELRAEHAHQYLFSTSLTSLVSFGNNFGLRPTWISFTYTRLHQRCKSHHPKVAISYFSSKGFLADMLGAAKNSGFPEGSLFPFLNPRVQFVST